ncbi:diacylglycerol kinase family protein [Spirosoma sp. BT702]|uniref:Diacylglycerol kinase family protein n=1 Tax=Spirosoma profusum TaxID=2771354 RepID=A0A926XYF3_9BACT|nr:diacylglycerol kinase family protein [Spirosoma profusum]MBD2703134.1 diacylglycerol kinase family protein [Spirosoma profusum]
MNGIRKHVASYKHGMRGIKLAFRYEFAMRFHLIAAVGVILVNYLLQISRTEWLITLILIGLAWMAEAFNTALEKVADRITQDQDVLIGQAKDLASGAVTIICLFAVVCALIIYFPYLF